MSFLFKFLSIRGEKLVSYQSRFFSVSNFKNIQVFLRRKLNMASSTILDKGEFQKILSPELEKLSKSFIDDGFEIRIVGGAVRDFLLGIQPKDFDLSTNATPEEMIKVFQKSNIKYFETGLQHGTLTAHINHLNFEVTTLRIDRETDGRHAKVEFTKDWALDAERRDLTINSMSISFDGTLYDYFGGKRDLESKRIAFVGDSRERIKEDYLRILRYFRFYSRIAEHPNQHEADTLQAIRELASGLKNVAVERIWLEMSKILVGSFAPDILEKLYELGVSENICLPSYKKERMQEFSLVWQRMNTGGYRLMPVSLLVSLISTPDDAVQLTYKWKLSKNDISLGKFVAANRHLQSKENPLKPFQDIIVNGQRNSFEVLRKQVIETLCYQGNPELAQEIRSWEIPVFPVSGGDLIKAGIGKGPHFGRTLRRLKEIWIESSFTETRSDLLQKLDNIKE